MSSGVRILIAAFAKVPGVNPDTVDLFGLVRALRGELDLITVRGEGQAHLERFGSARMFRVPVPTRSDDVGEQHAAYVRAVQRQIESQAYDLVHVRGALEGAVCAKAKSKLGFRLIYEVAGFPGGDSRARNGQAEWIDAHERTLRAADIVLVSTEAGARAVATRGHAEKVTVLQPSVNIDRFDWWSSASSDVLRVLCLGTYDSDRDFATVVRAVGKVARQRPVRALLTGEGTARDRERIRELAASLHLEDVVDVRGEPKEANLASLIAAADLCVVSAAAVPRFSVFGDLPQPMLELMACRRPIVAAGVPGVMEIVADQRDALLYPPGDPRALADAVLAIANDRVLRAKLAGSAYERVRNRFTASARRRRVAQVYETLLPGSQRFDAWVDAFDSEVTGQEAAPSAVFEDDTRLAAVAVVGDDAALVNDVYTDSAIALEDYETGEFDPRPLPRERTDGKSKGRKRKKRDTVPGLTNIGAPDSSPPRAPKRT